MALTDFLNNPEMVIVAGIGALLVVWLLLSMRGRGGEAGGGRGGSKAEAAYQAERDAMRANHAVEIAALETKLAEAQRRAQTDTDSVFRIKELEGARDKAVAEVEHLRTEAKELRNALEEGKAALARVQAEGAAQSDLVSRLARERDELSSALDGLKSAKSALEMKLTAAEEGAAARDTLEREVAELKARETSLSGLVADHEKTIADLRAALDATSGKVDASELDSLRHQMAEHAEREKSANETLSRLSYEHEGVKNRLGQAERTEREARAASEKAQAMLELRQQKIYALEERLREQDGEMKAAQRRVEVAEATAESLRQASASGAETNAHEARIKALEAALERAGFEEQRLRGELEAAQQAAPPAASYEEAREIAEALSAAQAEAEELRREVVHLRAAAPISDGPSDIRALRQAIRKLAERFVEDAESVLDAGNGEPTLSDRIRAFKASRDARRPLRIAAPKEG